MRLIGEKCEIQESMMQLCKIREKKRIKLISMILLFQWLI